MTDQLITYRLPIEYSLISLMSLMSSISYAWSLWAAQGLSLGYVIGNVGLQRHGWINMDNAEFRIYSPGINNIPSSVSIGSQKDSLEAKMNY